jgi:hypothetical protein
LLGPSATLTIRKVKPGKYQSVNKAVTMRTATQPMARASLRFVFEFA